MYVWWNRYEKFIIKIEILSFLKYCGKYIISFDENCCFGIKILMSYKKEVLYYEQTKQFLIEHWVSYLSMHETNWMTYF